MRRERSRSLLLLSRMNLELPISTIEQKVQELLATEPGYFLVEVKINSGNNIKVFIDADQGASIDKLVPYNRKLYRWIEEGGLFPGNNFSLEVSSPGLEEPLKLHRQYVKNIGRFVEVTTTDEAKREGKLISVGEADITIEEEKGKGKKKEIAQNAIPFDNIKTITVQIKF
ncbi:MAG: ribosome maturation factor [Bacteroidota bacterium]